MENKLQYFHAIGEYKNGAKNEYTVVIRTPTNEQLKLMVQYLMDHKRGTITIPIGISKVHPKENYIKKIGREESQKKITEAAFELIRIHFNAEDNTLIFKSGSIILTFVTKKDWQTPHLIDVNIYGN